MNTFFTMMFARAFPIVPRFIESRVLMRSYCLTTPNRRARRRALVMVFG